MKQKQAPEYGGLGHARGLFEAVCNNATVAIFLMDERQQCIYLNPAAEILTGYTLAEVRNRPLHDVIHHTRPDGRPYPLSECPIDRAFPQNQQEQGEEVFVHKDGSFYPVAYTASPIREEGTIVGTIIEVRSIQAEKEQKRALEEETRTLETLNRTGAMLAGKLDLEDIVQAVTDAATELTSAQFGAFFYNSRNDEGEIYQLYTLSGVPREAFARFPMPRNTPVFGPTFRGEGIVRSDDITADPRYGRNPPYKGMPSGHLPVRSYLAVPVVSRSGEVLGGLFFGHEERGVFTRRAERIVAGVAAQASVAIDNARLFQQAQTEIAERRRAEELQKLLNDELNHRVKNMLATVQAIAAQTLRGAPADDKEAFEDRLLALSRAHSLLLRENWEGVGFRELAHKILEPFAAPEAHALRYELAGEDIRLRPKQALSLAMALHELATNAAKYGALSKETGRVALTWGVEERPRGERLTIHWQERGGPAVEAPATKGFGSRLIERGLARELGGSAELRYERAGVTCLIDIPAPG
jgi:PAS domain S-box-containing protein